MTNKPTYSVYPEELADWHASLDRIYALLDIEFPGGPPPSLAEKISYLEMALDITRGNLK